MTLSELIREQKLGWQELSQISFLYDQINPHHLMLFPESRMSNGNKDPGLR